MWETPCFQLTLISYCFGGNRYFWKRKVWSLRISVNVLIGTFYIHNSYCSFLLATLFNLEWHIIYFVHYFSKLVQLLIMFRKVSSTFANKQFCLANLPIVILKCTKIINNNPTSRYFHVWNASVMGTYSYYSILFLPQNLSK